MPTFYDILEVQEDATMAEIKASWKQLNRKYHPDRNSEPTAVLGCQLINNAYDTLSDTVNRKNYDSKLAEERKAEQTQKHQQQGQCSSEKKAREDWQRAKDQKAREDRQREEDQKKQEELRKASYRNADYSFIDVKDSIEEELIGDLRWAYFWRSSEFKKHVKNSDLPDKLKKKFFKEKIYKNNNYLFNELENFFALPSYLKIKREPYKAYPFLKSRLLDDF